MNSPGTLRVNSLIIFTRSLKEGITNSWGVSGIGIFFLIGVLLLAGCAKTSYREQVLQDVQFRAQERILHRARVDREQGQYQNAIDRLTRMLTMYPNTPLEGEARLVLARSYQDSGDLRAALTQYQQVTELSQGEEYKKEARRRINQIKPLLKNSQLEFVKVRAVRVSIDGLAPGRDLDSWLQKMVDLGMTTILFDIGCGEATTRSDEKRVKSSTLKNKSNPLIPQRWNYLVAQSRQRGLTVFAGVHLRCAGHFSVNGSNGWGDRSYDVRTRSLQPSPYFDIFNAHYQKFLQKFLMQLANSKMEGVIFFADSPLGVREGFSPSAQRAFSQAFGIGLNPETFFARQNGLPTVQSATTDHKIEEMTVQVAPDYWRWAGWKTRERLRMMNALISQVHKQKPQMRFGLEIHSESISDPVHALVQYSEDFLEAAQGKFTFFFIRPDWDGYSSANRTGNGREGLKANPRRVIKRMIEVTEDPQKIWVSVPRMKNPSSWTSGSIEQLSRDLRFPKGVGLVYDSPPIP